MKKLLLATLATAVLYTAACTNSTPASSATVATQAQTARNKAVVLDFYELAFNQHKLQAAVDKHVGSTYIQHNPTVADGSQAFIDAFAPYLKANPQARADIKRVVAEGDLVVLHVLSQSNPQDSGEAIVDIFRVDSQGKIVEHWDVIQTIPKQAANHNGMF